MLSLKPDTGFVHDAGKTVLYLLPHYVAHRSLPFGMNTLTGTRTNRLASAIPFTWVFMESSPFESAPGDFVPRNEPLRFHYPLATAKCTGQPAFRSQHARDFDIDPDVLDGRAAASNCPTAARPTASTLLSSQGRTTEHSWSTSSPKTHRGRPMDRASAGELGHGKDVFHRRRAWRPP